MARTTSGSDMAGRADTAGEPHTSHLRTERLGGLCIVLSAVYEFHLLRKGHQVMGWLSVDFMHLFGVRGSISGITAKDDTHDLDCARRNTTEADSREQFRATLLCSTFNTYDGGGEVISEVAAL